MITLKDYMHKASRLIVNQAADKSLNTIVIGYSKGWKQDTSMSKKVNQNFVQIPFWSFVQMIQYKAKLLGISVILQEESYTSKCSFFDGDYIPTYGVDDELFRPSGKRIKRGLFRWAAGLVNAGVNGSLNIAWKFFKVTPDAMLGSRGLVVRPVRIVLTH